jgi:hypothetical protein
MRYFMLFSLLILSLCGCKSLSLGDPLSGEYGGYGVKPLNSEATANSKKLVAEIAGEAGADIASYQACAGLPYISASADLKGMTEDNCVALRNTMVSIVILQSEEACVTHRRSIYGKEASFNIAAGTFTNLFSGWAAVAPSAHGKAILAALALFSNSERSLVNDIVYKSMIVPAVDRKILALREENAQIVESHFKDTIKDYPITMGMRDAVNFHYSCSFMSGLEKLIEEGTNESARQKVVRLNRSADAIYARMQVLATQKRTADPDYASLKQRYESLTTEIISLEKQ